MLCTAVVLCLDRPSNSDSASVKCESPHSSTLLHPSRVRRVLTHLHRWIETAVPTGYVLLVAALTIGKCTASRIAPRWRSHSRVPLGADPDIERPAEHVQPIAVVKYALSWVVAFVHAWALLDRMDDLKDTRWRLVKPAAQLLAWVRASVHSAACAPVGAPNGLNRLLSSRSNRTASDAGAALVLLLMGSLQWCARHMCWRWRMHGPTWTWQPCRAMCAATRWPSLHSRLCCLCWSRAPSKSQRPFHRVCTHTRCPQ